MQYKNIANMKYWFELLKTDYEPTECFIPDGTVAKAKKYAISYMKDNHIEEAILTRNSMSTSDLLECIDLKI